MRNAEDFDGVGEMPTLPVEYRTRAMPDDVRAVLKFFDTNDDGYINTAVGPDTTSRHLNLSRVALRHLSLILNSVSNLLSMVWFRIPLDQS